MKIQTGKALEFEEQDKPKIDEGIYKANLKEVKEISDGQYGPRAAFIYTIIDKETDLVHIAYIPELATENNKYGQILMAHGIDLENAGEVDTDNLPQQTVRVMVEDYEYEKEEAGQKVKKKASTISKVKVLVEPEPTNTTQPKVSETFQG